MVYCDEKTSIPLILHVPTLILGSAILVLSGEAMKSLKFLLPFMINIMVLPESNVTQIINFGLLK